MTHWPLSTFLYFVDSFYLSFPVPSYLTIYSCTLMEGKEREINTCAQPPCFIRWPRTFLQMKIKLSNSKKCFKIQFWLASCNLYDLGVGKNLPTKIQSPEAVKEKAGEPASLKIKTNEWLTEQHIKTLCQEFFSSRGLCENFKLPCSSFLEATWQYPNFLMLYQSATSANLFLYIYYSQLTKLCVFMCVYAYI